MKLEAVKRFFGLIEQFSDSETDFRQILHPDIEQTEFPNSLTPGVAVSNFEVLMQRLPNGKKLLKEQKYDIQRTYEAGDALITEVIWTAEIGADAGAFKAGQQLKAYFCCVFEFKDGKIFRQRNYDCFGSADEGRFGRWACCGCAMRYRPRNIAFSLDSFRII